jgi:hypothetical protein
MNRFRRQTLEQALAIANPGPLEWPEETEPGILHLLWTAYDRLLSTKLSKINIHEADLQLERAITALLSDEIQDILQEEGGYASYRVSHERWEMETLDPQSNRPPQYDIAFVWRDHEYLKWPCEAKVLKHEKDIHAYILDVQDAFVPCNYAPFSGSAAMLGFLVTGDPHEALRLIGTELEVAIAKHSSHPHRPHGQCSLPRKVPHGKSYPNPLTLHHLILELAPTTKSAI